MTEKEKKRFQEMSEKDKERFNKEMSYYSAAGNMGQMNMGGGKMGGKGSRKRKRPKDPNAPKRALSAFMWFCKAERPNVKGANPELKMGQIAKVLSEQWKVCPNKHVYEGQADNDKERYREAMVHWKKIAPPPSTSKHHYQDGMFGHHDTHHHHKVPRDPDLPKRPLSAFMWFCKAERPAVRDANPELKVGQIAQILSEHWKACPDKTRFEEEANADKLRYREQINEYKAMNPNRPKQNQQHHFNDMGFDLGGHAPHRSHSKPPRDPDLPKRPLSAFMWFQKAQRSAVSETNPDLKVGQIAQILSEQWKVCLNKEQYEELANADKRRYAEEMKVYKAKKGEVHHVRPSPSHPASAAVGMMPSPQSMAHAQGHLPMPPKRTRTDQEHSSSGSDSSGSESDSDEDDDEEESD
ncbi:high mobility group protein B1-like isoform X3 [Lineus longissimus]